MTSGVAAAAALPVGRAYRERRSMVKAMLLLPTTLWFLLLLLMPLVVILVFSFGERSAVGGYAGGFTLANYLNLGSRGAAFSNTLHDTGGGSGDSDRASREEERALLAICGYAAVEEADRLAKARYLLAIEARGELDLPEHMQTVLRSTMWKG